MTKNNSNPKCKYCYDKGYYSVATGGSYAAGDFIGDKDYKVPIKIEQRRCSKCNLPKQPKEKTCDCKNHFHQVCDICQGVEKQLPDPDNATKNSPEELTFTIKKVPDWRADQSCNYRQKGLQYAGKLFGFHTFVDLDLDRTRFKFVQVPINETKPTERWEKEIFALQGKEIVNPEILINKIHSLVQEERERCLDVVCDHLSVVAPHLATIWEGKRVLEFCNRFQQQILNDNQ